MNFVPYNKKQIADLKTKYILFVFILSISTYANSQTQCFDPELVCDTCACIALWDPVMGCDGEIYGNSCEAYISGISTWIPYLATEFVIIDSPSQINKGESATLLVEHKNVSPAVVSYEWDHGANGKEIEVTPDVSTTYRVTITVIYAFSFEDGSSYSYTDENVFDVYIEVEDPTGNVDYSKETNQLKIFPVPANNKLTIFSDKTISHIQIIDSKGVTIKDLEVSNTNATIDISAILTGIYFLKIYNKDTITLKKIRVD